MRGGQCSKKTEKPEAIPDSNRDSASVQCHARAMDFCCSVELNINSVLNDHLVKCWALKINIRQRGSVNWKIISMEN